MKTYWHFAKIVDGKPVMRDGTPIEPGREYTTDRVKLCEIGYHGSERIIDALKYAPGPWISKRIISGDIDRGYDHEAVLREQVKGHNAILEKVPEDINGKS